MGRIPGGGDALPYPVPGEAEGGVRTAMVISWLRCWEAVPKKGMKGHDRTHSTTTTTTSQASEGSVTVNGYGSTDVRIYPPPSPSLRVTRGHGSPNQLTVGNFKSALHYELF